jgi:hypothetical protein
MSSVDNKDCKSGLSVEPATADRLSFGDAPTIAASFSFGDALKPTSVRKLGKKLPPAKEAFQRANYVKLVEINEYLQTTVDTLIAAIKNVSSLGGMDLSIRVQETPVCQSLDGIGALERTPQDPSQFVMRVPHGHTTQQIFAVIFDVFIECNAKSKAGDAVYSITLSRPPYPTIDISWNTQKDADLVSH